MNSKTLSALLLAAALFPFAALAEDTPLDIKTDLKGKFYLVEKAGTTNNPELVIKSVSGDYSDYTRREFDCATHSVRYLSSGSSLQTMDVVHDSKLSPVEPDSINDQLFRLACTDQ